MFDEQELVGAETLVWYQYIKGMQEPHIAAWMGAAPVFRNDKYVLPLQLADMAAWHVRRCKEFPDEDLNTLPTAVIETFPYADAHRIERFL